MTSRVAPRLFLAALLWLASTLADTSAPRLPDRLIHAVTALALSALLLDLARRMRAHGLYGALALAGLYGLAAVILFEPIVSANELPRLLVTRGLGAQTLVGLSLLTVWLTALRGRPLALSIGAAALAGVIGFAGSRGTPATLILTLALIASASVLYWLTSRSKPDAVPADMALSWRSLPIIILVVGVMIAYRLSTGALDPLALAIAALLMAFTLVLLWFQRSKRAVSLLETALPPAPRRAVFLLVPVALVVGAFIGAALIPKAQLHDGLDAVITAFGIVWLPAMSFAIGARSMLRQVRAQQL